MKSPYAFLAAALVATVAVLAKSPVEAADWLRYCNARFGQCADIPGAFRSDPPPENGDGLIFRDGLGMSIAVSAMYNVTEATLASERESYIETAGPPTYQAQGSNWFVISGPSGAGVFYVKCYVTHSAISTLWIEYPAARKSAYDAIVPRVASSFTSAR
jgi:hypothetical protein